MDYEYQPLNALGLAEDDLRIRVLHLLPRKTDEDRIHCYLRHTSLHEQIRYEALSYVWGDPLDTVRVNINGSVALITRNLHQALGGLRLETESRVLWVDALCINQADAREKEQQVQLMRQIYQRCQRVLIWLGKAHAGYSRPAMRLIKILSEASQRYDIPNMPNFDIRTLQQYGIPSLFNRGHVGILELAKLSWFRRAWVILEALLSPAARLHWGQDPSETAAWEDVLRAVRVIVLLKLPIAFEPAFSHMRTICENKDMLERGSYMPFVHTLARYQRTQATEPRDKVFAFLGLMHPKETDALAIKVKYTGPEAPIFEDLARSIIRHEQSLQILSMTAALPPSKLPNLPSWVPDWSASRDGGLPPTSKVVPLVTLSSDEMLEPFNAARGSEYIFARSVSPGCLTVQGLVIDQVVSLSSTLAAESMSYAPRGIIRSMGALAKLCSQIAEWERFAMQTEQYVTGEAMQETIWRTLCCNRLRKSDSISELRQGFARLLAHHRRVAALARVPLLWPIAFALLTLWGIIETYVLRHQIRTIPQSRSTGAVGRRMIRTRRGFIGLAAPNTSAGDDIVVVRGSTLPLILRQGGRNSWQFIGDAYIHGIMNGEAFDQDMCKSMDIR